MGNPKSKIQNPGKFFYITTPIYYINAIPHIGTAYTTLAADLVARFKRLRGVPVLFVTGTDEHAEKVMNSAIARGLSPKAHADEMANQYREAWAKLDITFDDFIRTSEERHRRATQEVFRRLLASGDIYRDEYEGWYCTPCATYYSTGELLNGRCPNPECGGPVEQAREPAYFFRASGYADAVAAHILAQPEFILPDFRRNEVLAFIRSGLRDACISRANRGWGIPVPGDEGHVVYVWFDALINYLTVAGFPDDMERFERVWPADLHLIGKDILTRFHGSLWPAMLMALDLPLPRSIVAHGYWLMAKGKISKSRGNVVSPFELAEELSAQTGMSEPVALDVVRYFLFREIPFGFDGEFSHQALYTRLNADLANDLGNALNRSLPLIERYFDGTVPAGALDSAVAAATGRVAAEVAERMDACDFRGALEAVWELLAVLNKYIDTASPWTLGRQGRQEELADALFTVAETLRRIGVMLWAFIPHAVTEMRRQMGLPPQVEGTWDEELGQDGVAGARIDRGAPIFPRIEIEAEEAKSVPEEEQPSSDIRHPTSDIPTLTFDQFSRMDLRVCEVLSVENVPGTERLYRMEVDAGTERRQVVAGIAHRFAPEELVGKRLVLVANLEPTTIRGVESQGMILAVGEKEPLALITVDRDVPVGSKVR